MFMTKEECEQALEELRNWCDGGYFVYWREYYEILQQLIKEHFEPQPYKFEEYYDGMFVWDDEWKQLRVLMDAQDFEEGRFFPLTKAYQEKG